MEPWWLTAGLAGASVAGLLYARRERRLKQALDSFFPRRLQETNTRISIVRERMRAGLSMLALLGVACALARPVAGEREVETVSHGGSSVALILLDVSRSMLAGDVAPDRLTRARLFGEDLLESLGGVEVGLAAFAGEARLLVPPTYDHGLVGLRLREAGPESVGLGGTNMENALHEALAVLGPLAYPNKSVFLLSDGEDLEGSTERVARALAENGILLHAAVFGTEEGTPVRVEDGRNGWDYIRDPAGQTVRSRARPKWLEDLAGVTGGRLLSTGQAVPEGTQLKQEIGESVVTVAVEWYWVPAAMAFLCAAASLLIDPRRIRAGVGS